MTKTRMAVLGMLLVLAGSFVQAGSAPQKDELKKLKDEIGLMDSVLNQSISQAFATPFGVLDDARGAYLPGYGVVIDFELNLSPASASMGPFSSPPTPQQERARLEEETRRGGQAKELAEKVLADFGHTLSDLPPRESVAIVIHTVAVREQGLQRSVIIVQAAKESIDQYRANAIDRAAFLRKLEIVEY
jgi:hypothetical protein